MCLLFRGFTVCHFYWKNDIIMCSCQGMLQGCHVARMYWGEQSLSLSSVWTHTELAASLVNLGKLYELLLLEASGTESTKSYSTSHKRQHWMWNWKKLLPYRNVVLEMSCHGNFGLAKILVRGTKIPGKFGPPDYYFQKILVRTWNNGLSATTSV